jgi:tRNA G10  N-methylase Trm11
VLELFQKGFYFEKFSPVCPGFYCATAKEIQAPEDFFKSIGGSIRMLEEIRMQNSECGISENIADYLDQEFSEGKIQFGLSVFPERKVMSKEIALEVKKELKKRGRSVRCINRNFQNLDAGTLHKEKIFSKKGGSEIVILRQKNGEPIVARTLAAQNVEDFSLRDYHKPERDMQVGMLPPKIALMMVNMASRNGEPPKHIWDPFCGTGTVNIEAERLGIQNIGSDISPKMIDAAQKNFQHFYGKTGEFFVHDAARKLQMTNGSSPIEYDAIVSEGYLGPIFGQPLSEKDLQNAQNKVEPIMRKFFREIGEMKNIHTIVISLPFWRMKNGRDGFCESVFMEMQKSWRSVITRDLSTSRGSLLYRRESQVVGREIFVLER